MGTEPVVVEQSSELEAKWGDKSLKTKVKYLAELIAIFCLCLLGLACYGGYIHIQESKEANKRTLEVLEKIGDNADKQASKTVAAIREQTCLNSLSDVERKADFASPHSWCKTITGVTR